MVFVDKYDIREADMYFAGVGRNIYFGIDESDC